MGAMPHIDLLELPYFEGIDIGDLVSLIDAMQPRQFSTGQLLIDEGDKNLVPLFIITKGLVDVTQKDGKQNQGAPCLLAQHSAPTLVGEVELFLAQPPVSSVRAITQVSTFVLEPRVLEALRAQRHPALLPFLFHVAQVACARLVHSDHMMMRALRHHDEPALAPEHDVR